MKLRKQIGLRFSANDCGILKAVLFILFITSDPHAYCQSTDTLAVIGDKVITTGEFIRDYSEKINSTGLTDRIETRSKYLQNLIDDELLIAGAKKIGLDKSPEAKSEYKRIHTQELLNAFSVKHISPGIKVSDSDLKNLFAKLNTKIKVSHIYAPEKAKADSLFKVLQTGKSFEEIARENFDDPSLKETGGSLGYISVDEMDPDFERTVFMMKPGQISAPVKTVKGYSIIRVEDVKSNPLLTETEFLKAYNRLKTFARKRAYEDAAKKFASMLREKLNTRLNNGITAKLFRSFNADPGKIFMENQEGIDKADLSEIAVFTSAGNWSLNRLLDSFKTVTDKQWKWIRTRENFEDFIYGLVNRDYMVNKALEEKLDANQDFLQKVNFNFDSYLLAAFEKQLTAQIIIPQDYVKSYYEENKKLIMTELMLRLSSILLENKSASDSAAALLKSGHAFEDVSAEFSIQKFTAERGGDMGYFAEKDLGFLADEVLKLKPGEWAGPFNDDGKYIYLKCTAIKNPEIISFEKSEKQIEEQLITLKWFDLRNVYVQKLKKEIAVKYFSEKLKKIIL